MSRRRSSDDAGADDEALRWASFAAAARRVRDPPPQLASDRGANARAYLEQRGIPADRLAETTLGLIPPADELRSALRRLGYTTDELHASGLFADTRWPRRIVGAWRDQHPHLYRYLRGATRADAIPHGLSDGA